MGRKIRSNLPQVQEKLTPQWPYLKEFRSCNQEFKQKQKRNYDRRHRVRPLPDIPDGSEVWVSTDGRQSTGRVIARADAPRSYVVETPSGQLHRNHSHLNIIPHNRSTDIDDRSESSSTLNRTPIMTRSRTGTSIAPPVRFEPAS